jgi:hypothetical protein
MDPSTWYPMHYVYNWIQGENIRYIRNSSDKEVYNDALAQFKEFLYRRNFCENKVLRQLQLNDYNDRMALLRGEKPHQDRKDKGKMVDKRQDSYILIDNSGSRGIITSAVKQIDYIAREFNPTIGIHFLPVVKRGKSILTVVNKMRKN